MGSMGADANGVASARSMVGTFSGMTSSIAGSVGAVAAAAMSAGASGSAPVGTARGTSSPARLDGKARRGAVVLPSSAGEGAPIWGCVFSRDTTGFGVVAVLPASLMLSSSGGWCSVTSLCQKVPASLAWVPAAVIDAVSLAGVILASAV